MSEHTRKAIEKSPRFSLIIPAHNVAEYIERCLASVRRQDFADVEVIVICDSCTDSTEKLVELAGYTSISAKAGAPGLARNIGIEHASGEYLLFLDADDYFVVDYALSRIDQGLRNTGEPHLFHYGFMWGNQPCGGLQEDGSHFHHVWSRAWRQDAIGNSRFTSLPAGQDTVFTLALLEKPGLTHAVDDLPLVQHVLLRTGSVTLEHLTRKRRGDTSMMAGLEEHLAQEMEKARHSPVG